MKKSVSIIMLSLFVISMAIFSLNVVSARFDLSEGSEQIVTWIQEMFGPFVSALFGGTSEMLFEKALLFIVFLLFVYIVLEKVDIFKNNYAVLWIVSIGVALLGTRFLSEEAMTKGILLPYTITGVAIMSVIPLVIYFYFVEKAISSSLIRRIAWIVYACIFIGLWIERFSEIGTLAWIYFAAGIIGLICALFDRTIQASFLRSAVKRGFDETKAREATRLESEIEEDTRLLASARGPNADRLREGIKRKGKRLKEIYKLRY